MALRLVAAGKEFIGGRCREHRMRRHESRLAAKNGRPTSAATASIPSGPDTFSLMAKKRIWLIALIGVALLGAQEMGHQPQGNQILGPGQPNGGPGAWVGELFEFKNDATADHDAWLRDLKAWRAERKTRMGYDDSEYRRPEFQWVERNFIAPQVMVEERTLLM